MLTDKPLVIGALIFSDMNQLDFTGPFEVLTRTPDSRFLVVGKTKEPITDVQGLILTPEASIEECPQLDVLVVPGGIGADRLLEDAAVVDFIRRQAAGAQLVLSVCTGALLCGAAGLLNGRRATTHWASHHLLAAFGAIPIDERVVVDGSFVFAAGVTSGIDGALQAVALLRGQAAAQEIQLYLEYAPEPPFPGGTPSTSPTETVATLRAQLRSIIDRRAEIIVRLTSHAS